MLSLTVVTPQRSGFQRVTLFALRSTCQQRPVWDPTFSLLACLLSLL